MPDFRTIVVHEGLRSVHRRNFLAHEIGHAVHGHRDDRPKHEAQADRFAALHLIDPEEAADVCRWAPDAQTAAAELRVTVRLLEAWFRANRAAG